jgi:membrane peptidoglycan carboxypeptidase
VEKVIRTARELGIRTPLLPYVSTALGASEVVLLELASAYRAIASGVLAEPHVIEWVHDASGRVLYEAPRRTREIGPAGLRMIQEGLRGVIRLPSGTGHALGGRDFPIPVMGKTGTTSDFRDALFVGSTYGPTGVTVGMRIGFDDNRMLGDKEGGGRGSLPIFREIMLRVYRAKLVGPVPEFPPAIEEGIAEYLAMQAARQAGRDQPPSALDDGLIARGLGRRDRAPVSLPEPTDGGKMRPTLRFPARRVGEASYRAAANVRGPPSPPAAPESSRPAPSRSPARTRRSACA